MRITVKTEEWVKCPVCSGTGVRPVGRVPPAALSSRYRARLAQGICLACGGLGQRKVVKRQLVARAGFLRWLWSYIF